MFPISFYSQEFVVGYHDKVIFLNAKNGEIVREIKVCPVGLITKNENKGEIHSTSDIEKEKITNISSSIQHIQISPNEEYLAVTTAGQKCLLLYKIEKSGKIDLLSTRSISRTSSAITFSKTSKNLLVCDKSGDCYLFDCENYNLPGKWILGHLSIVFDVTFSQDSKYIITCDRDEKIRVTNFPDTFEIESYCLGHEEFVSSISVLPIPQKNYLLSVSGDKTMIIWNFTNGTRVFSTPLEAPAIRHCLSKINENTFHIGVIVYQPDESVFIYELTYSEDSFECKLISRHSFNSKVVTNLYFEGDKLYLIVIDDQHIDLEVLKYKTGCYYKINDVLKNRVKDSFREYKITEFADVSLWFKKKFDNVSEYLERKKRRIEEKNSSK